MSCKLTLVVPNLRLDRLIDFFKKNQKIIDHDLDHRNFQIIIVSSALDNQALSIWKSQYPRVKWLIIEKNLGFASTVNLGFTLGCGEWLATVNDDVILSTNWWQKCLKHAKSDTGSINPIIYNSKGKIESAGVTVHAHGKAIPITKISKSNPSRVDATNAAAVIYNRDALKLVGFFDNFFGSYLEDIDLSLRLERAGFTNIVVNDVKIVHLGHGSAMHRRKKAWLDFRNWWLVIAKNWTAKKIIINLPQILIERARNFSGLIKNL